MITLSVDDGCASDIRVADLCRKYDIPCTFYWPIEWHSLAYDKGYEPLKFAQAYEIAQEFEIGAHGYTHRYLTKIPVEQAKYEIVAPMEVLYRMFGKLPTKFCPPRGYLSPALVDFVLDHYDEIRYTRGENLVHVHPNSGANDNRPWREALAEKPGAHLWGHSHEWDRFGLWEELEEVLREHTPR